ncbi:outer membrane beta-barrel protein [Pontibacter sp. 172403-2]|uniref:outer membrane beta-barrel protein n=1 Tax=Pontibacter rufus TaxID=2791028 RepID=UPI0018AFCD51|nr:outer membrane beta-barrel protein [Pontibacter sp. 172403-2]MBF9255672.1 outer membrane beta-barrel protein [Pontibacter sp. 172403-2]
MKEVLILLYICCFSFMALGQNPDTLQAQKAKYYVGLDLNGRYFLVDYDNSNPFIETSDYFVAKPYLHFGYRLNNRIRLEAGIAYAGEREHHYVTYVEAPGEYIDYHDYSLTRAIIIPLKITHDFFSVFKGRLAIYGTGSILPTYSKTRVRKVEVKANVSNTTLDIKDSATNTFVSLGVGTSFKIWKKVSGYQEVNILNRNLTTDRNIDPFWFERTQRPLSHLSLGIGINYGFRPE